MTGRPGPLRGRQLTRALFGVAIVCALLWVLLGLTPRPLLVNQGNGSYAVTDRNGQLLRLSLTSDEKYRLWTPFAELPPALQQATLHYEDRWFFYHPGVNPLAWPRALWSSLTSKQRWLGASTLTMQLARQRWRLKTDTLTGKLKQMGYAIWLERHFSKQELLQAYLNLAPYGANIEGAGAAAWIYFHKPVFRLTEHEARALALIPQNPRLRAPLSAAGRERLRQAWHVVYDNQPGFDTLWFRQRHELPVHAPHFAERLHELYPEQAQLPSTLDTTLQTLSEDLLASFLRQQRPLGIVNASAMVVHLPDMQVLGYLGSADYFNREIQGYVNGLKAARSPGSTLKPFIYALAIAQGLITQDSRVKDTPLRVGFYQPENFERNFYGPLSATDALVRSRNIPAISLLAQLQAPTFHEFLQESGISIPKQPANYGLSLAIGGAELAMEDLLRLYGVLANQGQLKPLQWLTDKTSAPAKAMLSPAAAFLVREMLTHNPPPQRSFGGHQFGETSPVAWKTGTSSGLKDAWAIGMRDDLLIGVWAGNFDGAPNRHLVGRDLVGPLLFDLFDAITIERQPAALNPLPPAELKRIEICPLSGQPVSAWCPHGQQGWIIPGVSPIKPCRIHRPIRVDPTSGLRLCPDDKTPGVTRVAEFWDSDELEAFRQMGVRRDSPPGFAAPCNQGEVTVQTQEPPKIISPQATLQYPLSAGANHTIEFSAISDNGHARLFWFVEDQFVGEGKTLLWPAKPGQYLVSVVNDQGQTSSTSLTVVQLQQ